MDPHAEEVLVALRRRGYRMTVQRRAIVDEVMRTTGHIAPQQIAQRVKQRLPDVNDSTIYRTLDLLEDIGFLAHSHLEAGPAYHHAGRHDHVHLICAACGRSETLSVDETEPLRRVLARDKGFLPDFSHFAISGLCRDCHTASAGSSAEALPRAEGIRHSRG